MADSKEESTVNGTVKKKVQSMAASEEESAVNGR